jgi:hypothetical protein
MLGIAFFRVMLAVIMLTVPKQTVNVGIPRLGLTDPKIVEVSDDLESTL